MSYVREKKMTIAGRSYGGYYQLVEGRREGGKVRQKVIAHLGKFPDIEAARRYADEHYSRTLEEVMRQFHEDHYMYNHLAFGTGTGEEKAAAKKAQDEVEAKAVRLYDSLSEDEQAAVRAMHIAPIVGELNRRENAALSAAVREHFGPLAARYKEQGPSDELTADTLEVYRSLTREEQVHATWIGARLIQPLVEKVLLPALRGY